MSVSEKKNEEEEEKEGQKREQRRSRALSCRPGGQIRRGLKSGVDCV